MLLTQLTNGEPLMDYANQEDKSERIKSFLKSDREDYVYFIEKELEGGEPTELQQAYNSKEKEKVKSNREKPSTDNFWMPNGIYGEIVDEPRYRKLDFDKFSLKALQHLASQKDGEKYQNLIETIDLVLETPQTYRRKQFRINLFESLQNKNSPYFDFGLYWDVKEFMVQKLNQVEDIVESEGFTVLSKVFDSFNFIAPKEDAEQLRDKINEQLSVHSLSLESERSVINFRNIAYFQKLDGEWYVRRTNGSNYDDVKVEVVKHLSELDFNSAYQALSEGKKKHNPNTDIFERYTACITRIKTADDYVDPEDK